MKNKFNSVQLLIFLVILIIITTAETSARKFISSDKLQGDQEANLSINNNISSKKSVAEMETTKDSFSKLMGVEECEEDEECLKRRVLAEVHLDYIYTQQHNP